MSFNTAENSHNNLNIRLKHPDQPKKEPESKQSPNKIKDKFANYDLEREERLKKLRKEYEEKQRESMAQCTKPVKSNQKSSATTSPTRFQDNFANYDLERKKKLQKLRDEYEEKELESMTQCTKPIKINKKSLSASSTPKKQVKTYNSVDIYNEEEPTTINSKYSINFENSLGEIFMNKTKKTFPNEDNDLYKKPKLSEKRNNKVDEIWDEDGSLLNTNRSQSSQPSAYQNEEEYYIDLPPSPKRVEPKKQYPSLVERAINSEKNKTPDSSFINSPESSKINSPYSTVADSPYSTKHNSPNSIKSNSPKSTSASFKEFEERQRRYVEQRENKRKEAEQKIIDDANRSYTLPKSKKLYKKRIQRNDDPIRQKKDEDEEINYSHIPDTSLSRKRIKDQPLSSIVKPWEMDSNPQQKEGKKNNSNNNSKKNTEKSLRIEDVEAYYISREVKIRSMEIEEECNKVVDCTFTPEKFSNYKVSSKPSSPDNSNKYIENADKQMGRSRLSGQKIREEEEIAKMKETKNANFVHKTAKIPNSTKKLMNIVNKLKKEEDDEIYHQKNDSLYDRSLGTMKRRDSKNYALAIINSSNKKEPDDE